VHPDKVTPVIILQVAQVEAVVVQVLPVAQLEEEMDYLVA
jgi:hypothetical protein